MADDEYEDTVAAGQEVSPELETPQPASVESHGDQPEGTSMTPEDTKPSEPAPSEPAPPAEPGMYWCDEEDPGIHPILGEIQHGENDYTGVTHPDSLQAIGDLVAAGVLKGPQDKA
jgi:hypothetical protein